MASVIGGTKLAAALQHIATNATKASKVDVGFLAGATYPDGTSVPMVAALNEFGRPDKGQPPRPFFRGMIADKSGEWPGAVSNLLKANDFDAAKTLDQAGGAIAGQLRQSIVNLTSPPLAQSTVDRKGFDKPLIDTGHMSNSIDHRVD
jgi:hypothetical protein